MTNRTISQPVGRVEWGKLIALSAGLALLVVGLTWPAASSQADILVMADGSQIATDGPWETKGRLIRFTLPNGTLGSVRLSEVDLDASAAATEEANRPAPEPEAEVVVKPKLEPILVLTDKDIPSGLSGDPGSVGSRQTDGDPVRVVSWTITPGADDPVYELNGILQNYGATTVENVQAFVDLVGAGPDGRPNADIHILREVMVVEPILEAGEATEFRYGISQRDLDSSGNPDAFNDPVANFDVRFSAVDTGDNPVPDNEDEDDVLP